MGSFDAEVAHDRPDVSGVSTQRVVLDRSGFARASEAAQIGRDHPVSGVCKTRDLVPPQPGGVREAMKEHHDLTFVRTVVGDDEFEIHG